MNALFHTRTLDEIRQNDPSLCAEILTDFQKSARALIAQAQKKRQDAQRLDVWKIAHNLYGGAANLGLMQFAGLCNRLCACCAEDANPQWHNTARQIIERLPGSLDATCEAVQVYLRSDDVMWPEKSAKRSSSS